MDGPIIDHQVDFLRQVGEDLIAKVELRVRRDEQDPHGDTLSIHVRLPPDAGSMPFGKLQALAVESALRLLGELSPHLRR